MNTISKVNDKHKLKDTNKKRNIKFRIKKKKGNRKVPEEEMKYPYIKAMRHYSRRSWKARNLYPFSKVRSPQILGDLEALMELEDSETQTIPRRIRNSFFYHQATPLNRIYKLRARRKMFVS